MSLLKCTVENVVTQAFNSNIDDILRTLFGSVRDENDVPFAIVYQHELKGILEDLVESLYHLHVCLPAEEPLTDKTIAIIILMSFGGVMVTKEDNTDLRGLSGVALQISQALTKPLCSGN